MKTLFTILILFFVMNCSAIRQSGSRVYYIYVKPQDTLFHKKMFKNGASIKYSCNCYARKNALEFTSADADTVGTSVKDTLPSKFYSMLEFAKVANQARNTFKNMDVGQAKIYIVEEIGKHKYLYYKATFYTIENDD